MRKNIFLFALWAIAVYLPLPLTLFLIRSRALSFDFKIIREEDLIFAVGLGLPIFIGLFLVKYLPVTEKTKRILFIATIALCFFFEWIAAYTLLKNFSLKALFT